MENNNDIKNVMEKALDEEIATMEQLLEKIENDMDDSEFTEDFGLEDEEEAYNGEPRFQPITIFISKVHPDAVIPKYAHDGFEDSGFDFVAIEDVLITPHSRVLVRTGLKVEIPKGLEIQVRPRSGAAIKQGLTVLNTPGTIDAGYRGEIKIILINVSDTPININKGDRIAQGVLAPVLFANFLEVVEVEEDSNRGETGFGESGK